MKTLSGITTGILLSVTTAILLAFYFHGLTPSLATTSLLLGLLGGLLCAYSTHSRPPLQKMTWTGALLLTTFAWASFRAFLWLIYPKDGWLHVLSPYNLGDLSFHMQLIGYLASGIPFWPASPILTHTPLIYPLGMDLFNALLLLTGINLTQGLIWTGILGATLTGWALWRWGGSFGLDHRRALLTDSAGPPDQPARPAKRSVPSPVYIARRVA